MDTLVADPADAMCWYGYSDIEKRFACIDSDDRKNFEIVGMGLAKIGVGK